MWFGNKWHGTSCKQEGAEDTTPVCPMFERIFDFTALREASPGMLRAKTALKQSSMNVPKFVLDELRTYLLAGGKGSVDWKHYVGRTDNQQSGKRLAHKMALLQAYKDRTIAVQDNIGNVKRRVDSLAATVRAEVATMNDISKLSPAKVKESVTEEVIRPVLDRQAYVDAAYELAKSVMFNLKNGIDVLREISALYQIHMRLS